MKNGQDIIKETQKLIQKIKFMDVLLCVGPQNKPT